MEFFQGSNLGLDSFGWAILHSLWQISLLALLVFIFQKITDDRQANQRYFFAFGSMVMCLMFFLFTFFSCYNSKLSTKNSENQNTVLTASTPAEKIITSPTFSDNKITSLHFFTKSEALPSFISWIGNKTQLISLLWCIGFIIYSIQYLVAFRLSKRLRTVGIKKVEPFWQQRFNNILTETEISKNTQLLYSTLIKSPVTIGFFKPLILVPTGFLMQLPPEQAEAVLLHEIAHIKRHDYLLNLFQISIKTIFFFHPGIRYISNMIDTEREHACDDFAIQRTCDPTSLAKAIGFLKIHSFSNLSAEPAGNQNLFAMNSVQKNHPVLRRLQRMFSTDEPQPAMKTHRFAILLLLIVAGVFFMTSGNAKIYHHEFTDPIKMAQADTIPPAPPLPDPAPPPPPAPKKAPLTKEPPAPPNPKPAPKPPVAPSVKIPPLATSPNDPSPSPVIISGQNATQQLALMPDETSSPSPVKIATLNRQDSIPPSTNEQLEILRLREQLKELKLRYEEEIKKNKKGDGQGSYPELIKLQGQFKSAKQKSDGEFPKKIKGEKYKVKSKEHKKASDPFKVKKNKPDKVRSKD